VGRWQEQLTGLFALSKMRAEADCGLPASVTLAEGRAGCN